MRSCLLLSWVSVIYLYFVLLHDDDGGTVTDEDSGMVAGLRGDRGEALDERCNFLFSVGGLKLFRFFFATTDDGAMMCGDNGTGGLFVQSSKQSGNDLMPPHRVELWRVDFFTLHDDCVVRRWSVVLSYFLVEIYAGQRRVVDVLADGSSVWTN